MKEKNNYSVSDILIAIFSFIPLLGVLLGIISIILGFTKKLRILIFAGIGGILFISNFIKRKMAFIRIH